MSMTREDARIELKAMKDTFEEYEPGGSRGQMALKVALSALRPVSRERVEKVWRGEWELVRRMAASIECKCPKCQRTVIFTGKPANFCEKCGSANTDEAVEMVMEKINNMEEMTNEH